MTVTTAILWIGAAIGQSDINVHLYPSNTQSVVIIDFASIRQTKAFAEQMAEDFEVFLQDNEHFRKLNEILGVNLSEATQMITICGGGRMGPPGGGRSGGGRSGRGDGGTFLSISNGNFMFDQVSKALVEMAERGELSTFNVNDLPIYFNHRSREAIYFGIVDDGVMIASSKKSTIEDSIQGLTELRQPNAELMERLKWSAEDTKEIEEKPSVYLAGVFPEEARKQLEESPLRAFAKDMVGYNMTIHLGEKAMFRGRLELASEASAAQAEKTFNLFFGMMKGMMTDGGKRTDTAELLSTAEIKANKKDLRFNMTAPRTLLASVSENDRKDPNSPRNRMRRMRDEQRKKEEAGESPTLEAAAKESANPPAETSASDEAK